MFILDYIKAAFDWLGFFQKSANIIFLGLDNAGKTTMLYMLQSDKFTQTDSTVHPHQAEVTIGNIKFNSYDLGGHSQARKVWREYTGTVDGIIFMVDAADQERLPEAKEELDKLLVMPELKEVPVVVFGNKIDRKEALKEEEFRDVMNLPFHLTKGKQPNNFNP
jgi:GTP-binding protein SAR1